jgi:hypothetical protein
VEWEWRWSWRMREQAEIAELRHPATDDNSSRVRWGLRRQGGSSLVPLPLHAISVLQRLPDSCSYTPDSCQTSPALASAPAHPFPQVPFRTYPHAALLRPLLKLDAEVSEARTRGVEVVDGDTDVAETAAGLLVARDVALEARVGLWVVLACLDDERDDEDGWEFRRGCVAK